MTDAALAGEPLSEFAEKHGQLGEKRAIIVFANCYGWPISSSLSGHSAQVRENYDVVVWMNFQDLPGNFASIASRCDYVFFQEELVNYVADRWERLKAALPSTAKIVRFAPFGFTPLWAQMIIDHSATIDLSLPDAKEPPFLWADRNVLKLKKQGVPKDELVEAHLTTDVAELFGAERMLELWKVKTRQRDACSDVGCGDIIEASFRDRQLFFWPWHCQDFLLVNLVERALDFLRLSPLDSAAYEIKNSLRDYELPVHPSILKALDVRYISPNQKYLSPWKQELTIREYYDAYVDHLFRLDAERKAPNR